MDTEYEKELRAIMVSCPKGETITIRKLYREYSEITGCHFPFEKLGYSSFLDYLKSIPHVVKVVNGYTWDSEVLPIMSSSTAHIRELVVGQKPSNGKSKCRRRNNNVSKPKGSGGGNSSHRPWNTWEFDTPDEDVDDNDYLTYWDSDEESSDDEICMKPVKKIEKKKINLPDGIRSALEKLIGSYPNGILLDEIKDVYRARFHKELDHYQFGYSRLIDFLTDVPEIMKLFEFKDYCFLVMDARKFTACEVPPDKNLALIVTRILDIVRRRQTIFADEIEHEYYERYKERMDVSEFGFDTSLELYKHLKDTWKFENLKNRVRVTQKNKNP